MMKRKNDTQAPRINRRMVLLFAIFGTMLLGRWLYGELQGVQPIVYRNETLFLTNRNSVTSTGEFEGWVTIEIAGSGMLEPAKFHDAFYVFSEKNIREETFYGLYINDHETNFTVFSLLFPPYESSHEYYFRYYNEEMSKLKFSIIKEHFASSNNFTIYITKEPLYSGR